MEDESWRALSALLPAAHQVNWFPGLPSLPYQHIQSHEWRVLQCISEALVYRENTISMILYTIALIPMPEVQLKLPCAEVLVAVPVQLVDCVTEDQMRAAAHACLSRQLHLTASDSSGYQIGKPVPHTSTRLPVRTHFLYHGLRTWVKSFGLNQSFDRPKPATLVPVTCA